MRLEGKVSLVTGSSRGIGRAIALAFAREGADVVLNCSRSMDSAGDVAGEIESLGKRALVIQADVADKAAIDAMIDEAVTEFGRLDVLVNNAGMSVVDPSEDLTEARWRQGIDVMLNGVFFCSQAAGKQMIRQKSGRIINIASINGIGAFPERVCYSTAKAGVMQMTRAVSYTHLTLPTN